MTPRNTNTGGVLEAVVVPALDRGGYEHETQVYVGLRCGGGIHKADALAARLRPDHRLSEVAADRRHVRTESAIRDNVSG